MPSHSQGLIKGTQVSVIIHARVISYTNQGWHKSALALIAVQLDGEEVSQYGNGLQQALLISPTIFPLLFAALMGRFFRHLGVYLAEQGTTLGRLEQLISYQSVFTALERRFILGCWSIIGLFSVSIWLLSPVEGQSALRLLKQRTEEVSFAANISYLDPNFVICCKIWIPIMNYQK
jgi:hypothetical protein